MAEKKETKKDNAAPIETVSSGEGEPIEEPKKKIVSASKRVVLEAELVHEIIRENDPQGRATCLTIVLPQRIPRTMGMLEEDVVRRNAERKQLESQHKEALGRLNARADVTKQMIELLGAASREAEKQAKAITAALKKAEKESGEIDGEATNQ